MHHEYPKYVNGIIAHSKEQEDALLGGTAKVEETKDAQGSKFTITATDAHESEVIVPAPSDPEPQPPVRVVVPPAPKPSKSKKKGR